MKFFSKYLKWFTLIVLFIVFTLQSIWLYQTFILSKTNYKKELQKELIKVSLIETVKRSTELGNSLSKEERNIPFEMPPDTTYAHKYFPLPIINLEHLYSKKFLIKLNRIDSALKTEKKISGNFVINRVRTKDNVVIESTAPETKAEWKSALKTEAIPLRVDESEVLQLCLLNPNWTIFYQMAFIIFLSALMIGLVAIGFWWQYKMYQKEKLLRIFQKDHTETVIHNMATPIQTIKLATESLKYGALQKEQQQKFLTIQERQILSLESQVQKILTVSRAKKSALSINTKEVNIKEFIQNICERHKRTKRKEIIIHTTFDLAKTTALLDVQLFTEVIDNLIENAIKYSMESVKIIVDCKRTNEEFIVKVTDNGLGIPPRYQKRIFEKFNRGAAPFRQGAKGFGIGLSFVKVVVEAHKGTISLFSKGENEGTAFTLRIPQ